MGAGVARQCSRNRCLARWTSGSPCVAPRDRAGRANSRKDLVTGPIRGSCALQAVSTAHATCLAERPVDLPRRGESKRLGS